MNKMILFLYAVFGLLVTMTVNASDPKKAPLRVGWVVGNIVDEQLKPLGPSILHTRNGGRTWVEQGDIKRWSGYVGNDVSAVDKTTAWVALSGPFEDDQGAILHTRNGGVEWVEQALPEAVASGMKQIKGLSRREAWAVSLQGVVLHTTDGGMIWKVVKTAPDIGNINRMDVIGCVDPHDARRPAKDKLMSNANIWITDDGGGEWGMIHSLYNGDLWRRERIPYLAPNSNVHMLDAYSPRVAWAAAWNDGTLYRTLNGGENWEVAATISGPDDFDDMCAPSPDTLWVVQNQQTAGEIFHARIPVDDSPNDVQGFDPVNGYLYEGLTCVDDDTALVVGFTLNRSLPTGIILSTTDGGESWTRHSAPLDNVSPWKASFVGARR